MPSAQQFIEGFDLYVGKVFGSYKVSNINIHEKLEVLYNEYSFPIIITLENTTNPSMDEANKAIQLLFNSLNSIKIIYTDSQRPYKSKFFHVQPTISHENNYSKIIFTTKGYAKRIGKAEVQRIEKDGQW